MKWVMYAAYVLGFMTAGAVEEYWLGVVLVVLSAFLHAGRDAMVYDEAVKK